MNPGKGTAGPRVSIVIPTYNQAHFLREALGCVRTQTMPNWEAIVVNNYSNDATAEVIQEFKDPRICCINFANRGVIAASRNEGVRRARSKVIAFLDSDDLWLSNKLEVCLDALSSGADLVCHNEMVLKGRDRIRELRYGPVSKATERGLLFGGSCLSPSAVVMKKEFFEAAGGFGEAPEIATAEDYDLWIRLARTGIRIRFIDEALGDYRVHKASASRAVLRHMNAVLEVVATNFALLSNPKFIDRILYRRRRAFIFYTGARAFIETRNHAEALRYLTKAMLEFPLFLRLVLGFLLLAHSALGKARERQAR